MTAAMKKYVEGDWKENIRFRQALESDYQELAAFLREHFYPDEPLSQLLEPDEEFLQDFEKLYRPFLQHNLSFVAVNKSTNAIVGVRMIFNHKKDIDWNKFNLTSAKVLKIMCGIQILDKESQLFDKYNLQSYADLFIASVHRNFRRKGLVTEMYRRAKDLTKAEGYFLAKACFSNPYSRAGASSSGFTQVASVHVQDIKDENGGYVFPNAKDGQLLTQAIYIL